MPKFRITKPQIRKDDGLTNEQRFRNNKAREEKYLQQAHIERFGLDKEKQKTKIKRATEYEKKVIKKEEKSSLLRNAKKKVRKQGLLWLPGKQKVKEGGGLQKLMMKTLEGRKGK